MGWLRPENWRSVASGWNGVRALLQERGGQSGAHGYAWDLARAAIRLWLGSTMIQSGQSILRFFSSPELRAFFVNWFGNELGFPAPLAMAFLAKSTEFICGALLCAGLLSRLSASLLAVVMIVATATANLDFSGVGDFIRPDGRVTITSALFAVVIVLQGPGRFSLDEWLRARSVRGSGARATAE